MVVTPFYSDAIQMRFSPYHRGQNSTIHAVNILVTSAPIQAVPQTRLLKTDAHKPYAGLTWEKFFDAQRQDTLLFNYSSRVARYSSPVVPGPCVRSANKTRNHLIAGRCGASTFAINHKTGSHHRLDRSGV